MSTPLFIVMTPVRNEAWVLHAFLRATSLWADYIIIADQMSTDGSRDIYPQYDKVVLIDNTNPNFNEAERQAMLVAKAREIAAGRDCILFGLDADEILQADWQNTPDGQRILHSVPGDVFWFRWAQLALHFLSVDVSRRRRRTARQLCPQYAQHAHPLSDRGEADVLCP